MASHDRDSLDSDRRLGRLLQEFESFIRDANAQRLGGVADCITKAAFLELAQTVAALRAAYLRETLRLSAADGRLPDAEILEAVRRHREAYEEALRGFGALRHALERGYLSLTD